MNKMTHWMPVLSLGIFACLISTFMGCGQQAGQGSNRFVIATVVKVDGIAWFEKMREGVQKFAKETGHDAFLLGPAKADAAEQIQIIEGLIAQQVDALCVVPFSVEALEPVLKKARARGIVVISHEASSQVNADLIIEAFDNANFGRHLMDHLAAAMNEEGEYATFVGSLTSKSHNEWIDAAVAHQKATYPNMQLVADKVESNDDQNQAYQKTKQLLTTYPNLKGIQSCAMSTAPGAALAIEEQGLQDRVNLVSTSLVSVTGQYLESGAAKLVSFWNPDDAGYVMCKMAQRLLQGETITDGTDMQVEGYRHLTQSPEKAILFQGSAWVDVTKENLAQWAE
jgi:simple sugar transport system substrate-binding protein